MSGPLRVALLSALALLGACQPVVRPTTPETAVIAPAPAAPPDVASVAPELAPPTEATLAPAGAATTSPAGDGPSADGAEPSRAIVRGADVFARIGRGLSPNACDAGSNSVRWRQRYAGNPAAFARRLEAVLPLIDFVSTEVERAGLPAEFVFIPLVESWYQPGAMGAGGPAGMWQMIGSTARNHGVHIKPGYDGRLSPVESTRAALSYLKTLQGMFGNWQAIVMAYNAGEGRLRGAFARANNRTASGAQRRPHGLSNITYDYVAKLQALSCLVSQPERNGLRLPTGARFEALVPLLMEPGLASLDEYASAHGKDADALRRMNPGYRNGRLVADVPRLVLAPPGMGDRAFPPVSPPVGSMLAVNDLEPASAAGERLPAVHRVRAGESLWSIARFYRLPLERLRRANGLGGKATVRPGQMLRLPP